MAECMEFPDTVEEFMEQYKLVDTEQVYTNGTEFVPIFRMKQWFEHERAKRTEPHECDNHYCIQNGGDLCDRVHCPIGREQETHGDLISRQAAIDAIRAMQTYKMFAGDDLLLVDQAGAMTELMMLPAADVVEVKRGKWIHDPGDRDSGYGGCIYCSECYQEPFYTTKTGYRLSDYCPNCGAKMTED